VIGFDQEFLGRQIYDDQIFGVRRRQRIDFYAAAAVAKNARPAAEGFDDKRRLAAL